LLIGRTKEKFDETMVFERVFFFFFLFGPCIEGFKYYKPLISVNDTHLYGQYAGKLLIVVVFYANNGLFPLAFTIVDEENNYN
jgi:hypothetical protein